MITPELLQEWHKLSDAAMRGPWSERWYKGKGYLYADSVSIAGFTIGSGDEIRFCRMARVAVPALIAEVERLRNLLFLHHDLSHIYRAAESTDLTCKICEGQL